MSNSPAVTALRLELAAFRGAFPGAVVGIVLGPRSLEDGLHLERAPAESNSLHAVIESLE